MEIKFESAYSACVNDYTFNLFLFKLAKSLVRVTRLEFKSKKFIKFMCLAFKRIHYLKPSLFNKPKILLN